MNQTGLIDRLNCIKFFCKKDIHSLSDWRKSALKKKQELQNAGIFEYERHPEYQQITKCKQDNNEFPSVMLCDHMNRQNQPVSTSRPAPYRPTPTQTYYRPTSTPYRQKPTARPTSTKTKQRCPNGTRINKRTGNCEPKNKRASPTRPASPPYPRSPAGKPASTKTKKRCPNGTRINKKTRNCEPKNKKTSPARPVSPPIRQENASKRGRCPNGTRFNKKTLNCEPKK